MREDVGSAVAALVLLSGEATLRDAVANPPAPGTPVLFSSADRGGEWTVGALCARAVSVAAALADRGVGPGDTVAVQVPNWPEALVAYLACFHLGAVIVPIVHIYGPAEVGFILAESGARVFVVPDRWRAIDYAAVVDVARTVASIDDVVIIGDARGSGGTPWAELEAAGAGRRPPEAHVRPDDTCLLVYTSGTTAAPKGVQHTHRTLLAEARSTAELLTSGPGAPVAPVVLLQSFPAGHIAGVLGALRPLVAGRATVSMDTWDAAHAAELVERHRVTFSAGTPLHLMSLLDAAAERGADLSSLVGYMTGAANVAPALVERAERAGIPTYRSYGSSEHPTVSSGTPLDPLDRRAGTDGRLLPGNEVRFIDDDGRDVATGHAGEICTRGPELFVGYRDASLDRDAFLPGGWFRTGDVGCLDADGYLTITDRKKDIIIRGGENISSKEVEDVLARHPGVGDVAVIGVPDDRYGERVCAVIIATPGAAPDLADLRRHVIDAGVARQKAPERLVVVDDLPRTAAGKIKKFELRARLLKGGAR